MSRFSRIVIVLILLAVVTGACSPVAPPHPRLAQRILFIGTGQSDWNQMNEQLARLAASADPPTTIETSNVIAYGTPLVKLWNYGTALDEIRTGDWDIVVLEETMYPYEGHDEQVFYEYARKFDEEITKTGAETALNMTWQQKPGPHSNSLTTDEIARVYNNIGKELGVKVAPVGLSWERSIEERPDLELYQSDGSHPNSNGTYLTISVLYATILERMSPRG